MYYLSWLQELHKEPEITSNWPQKKRLMQQTKFHLKNKKQDCPMLKASKSFFYELLQFTEVTDLKPDLPPNPMGKYISNNLYYGLNPIIYFH